LLGNEQRQNVDRDLRSSQTLARRLLWLTLEGGTILGSNREGLQMSTMNPLKFVGGLVLEVGAVIAALAILPGLGGSGLTNFGQLSSTSNDRLAMQGTSADIIPNQVFFNADSSRMIDEPQSRPTPSAYSQQKPAAWQNDFAPAPPVSQQRYVENMLDHNSQRALDAAARLWTQGDRLLPQELRVRREMPNHQVPSNHQTAGEPIRQYQQPQVRQPEPQQRYQPQPYQPQPYQPHSYQQPNSQQPRAVYSPDRESIAEEVLPSPPEVYRQPAQYAPASPAPQRYSVQEQPRYLDRRY
jgi:hypothetical protein